MPDERRILLIEDNDEHAELVGFVLRRTHPEVILHRAANGDDALAYLGSLEPEALPKLTLLDLKLPGMGGVEILTRIRDAPHLTNLAVVICTTSNSAHDRAQALEARANAFIVKPMEFGELKARLEATFRFWLDHAVD